MPDEIVLILGTLAAGKTTLVQPYVNQGYARLNRDEIGGRLLDLHNHLDATLSKRVKKAVLDNTFAEASSRKGVIEVAKKHGLPVKVVWLDTSLEDATVNACYRMFDRLGKVLNHNDEFKGVKDPNVFPIAALYGYRKRFEKPTTAEGIDTIEKVKFVRKPRGGKNKALILDMDDTVRRLKPGSGFTQKYPTETSHIEILPGRRERLTEYRDKGYLLLGASNQSGVAKGHLSLDQAKNCFQHTCDLLQLEIDIRFCPHNVGPPKGIECYCRKPGPSLLVTLICEYDLDPAQCVFVGDATTDRNAATRVGIPYQDQAEFFK